jgi:excisionase family DNA binding protein
MEQLLTIQEAAALLCLAPKTIYQYTSAKKIPFIKMGNAIRFRASDLEAWIKKHHVEPINK